MEDDRTMNDQPPGMDCETQLSSALAKSNMKNTVKIEDSNGIEIKSEPECPSPVDSEQAGHLIEPNCTIVKSEYEFQSSYLNWTKNEAEDNDEFDDDKNDEYDEDDEYNDEDDDYDENDVAKRRTANAREKRKYLDSYMLRACPYCRNEFESLATLSTHMDDVHNHNTMEETHFTKTDNGKAKCSECKTILPFRRDTLKRHVLMHLPHRNIYKCKLCSLIKSTQLSLFHHIEKKHFEVVGEAISDLRAKNDNVCAYCGKYVGVMQMVSMHIKREHAGIFEQKLWYICPFCGEQFAEEKCQKEHLTSKHKFDTLEGSSFEIVAEQGTSHGKKYRCLKCNELVFGNFFYVKFHALTHLPHKCFKCRFCDYTHEKKWRVIKHSCKDLLLDIKNNPNLTAKTKISKYRLPKLNVDAKNKIFVCPKCGENFEEMSLWEDHLIKVHGFNEIESLNIKITTSEDGKSVTRCTICEKTFTKCHIYNLKHHAFTHMPYKLYKCKLCEEPLNSISGCGCSCQKKIRIAETMLHVCPQCGKECTSQNKCYKHMKNVHDMRQPSGLGFSKIFLNENEAASYKCSECGEVIKESEPLCIDLMFKHASIKHMPYKRYKCDKCGVSNDIKEIMLKHSRTCTLKIIRTTEQDEAECIQIAKCQCHVCGYLGENEEIVVTHLRDVHQLGAVENHIFTWFCSECEFKTGTKEEILEHILNIHIKQRPMQSLINFVCFLCPVCNTEFHTKSEWYAHICNQHSLNTDEERKLEDHGDEWKCLECNKGYNKKSFRKFNHCIKHLPYKAFKCILCGAAFRELSIAKTHVASCSTKSIAKTSKENNTTEIIFTKAKKRKPENKIIESVDIPSIDPLQIDKSNVQNYSPTSMATSSPRTYAWNKYCKYMTYACPECNIPIATSEEWHMHISTHHDFFAEERLNTTLMPGKTNKRICAECGVTVHGSILHAQRHKLTHMPYQAFICKICQHRSKTNNVLIYHIERRHFTPGKFKCALCQAVFETCHKRFEHTKAVHTDDEWPDNVCRICMKELTSKYGCREHMKTHEYNRSTYDCGICKRKYYHRVERKKHWQQSHPDEYASMVKEEQEKLVIQKPVRKTKKYKRKKKVSESDEPSDSDSSNYSSSDSIVLSKLKATKRITTINTRSIEIKEEPQNEVNIEETLLIKNEPESSDTITLARLKPNKKRIRNKSRINEDTAKMKGEVKYEETAVLNEQIFKNEPSSDADDVNTEYEFKAI